MRLDRAAAHAELPSTCIERRQDTPLEGDTRMETDLRNLIDDSRFRAYHRELVEAREFNTFDVLRYSGYEIRHSNVLAWLLRPADTHGIGSRFLKWFVNHVIGRFEATDRERLTKTSFEAGNVEVWRERDYVDVTIFFKKEKWLIAVENKPESAHRDHLVQVMDYDRTLRDNHKDHTVGSVLLSTSPDGSAHFPDFPGVAHVGWDSVREAIGSVLADGGFPSPDVRAFIRQYLDMVARWFRPGSESFRALLADHRAILKEMRRILEKDGDGGVHAMVSADQTEYRDALAKLVRESRHDPKQLRALVANRLKGGGITPQYSNNPSRTVYWLQWKGHDLRNAVRSMGGQPGSLWWEMGFTHHGVDVDFVFYRNRKSSEEGSFVNRLVSFMEKTPINRQKPEEYSVQDKGYGWERVYREEILSNEELVEMSAPEVEHEVIQRLGDFMDSDDSEYRRIDDYFQCLAFGSDEAARCMDFATICSR